MKPLVEPLRPPATVCRRLTAAFLAALLLPTACAAPPAIEKPVDATPLVVWSGLDEATLGPLVDAFRQNGEAGEMGVEVEVRYGDAEALAGELTSGAGVMSTTGEPQPDVFLAPDALTLGTLAAGGLLRPLPVELAGAVPAHFADASGRWVGFTGRSREVVYDPARTRPEDLPQSLDGIGDPRFRGGFALAPKDPSFVAHLAVYRALNGVAAFDAWLARLATNEPMRVADDAAVVAAVAAGEVAWGLTGSDALCRFRAAMAGSAAEGATPAGTEPAAATGSDPPGAAAPALATFHMPSGDASGFVGVDGGGVLSEHPQAIAFIAYLLGAEAQHRLAEATCSYPLLTGMEPPAGLLSLAELDAPQIDFGEVATVRSATREALVGGPPTR